MLIKSEEIISIFSLVFSSEYKIISLLKDNITEVIYCKIIKNNEIFYLGFTEELLEENTETFEDYLSINEVEIEDMLLANPKHFLILCKSDREIVKTSLPLNPILICNN